MMLYNLLLRLEEKKIYRELICTAVIPVSVNSKFEMYKSYLLERRVEKRAEQAAYNVSVKFKCDLRTVYRAIEYMRRPVDTNCEFYFS